MTAGQPVVSGGTGGAPSCGIGTTAVLAPTYVSSGAGGKPTAEFSTVKVKIVNGTPSEGTANGEGNRSWATTKRESADRGCLSAR